MNLEALTVTLKDAFSLRAFRVSWTEFFSWPDAGGDICQAPGIRDGICGVERRYHTAGVTMFIDDIEIRPHKFVEKEK